MATPPAPGPPAGRGRATGRLGGTGRTGSSGSRARELEASPMGRELAAVLAPVDLQPAQRLVEITPAGEHLADPSRAVDLAQPRLGGEDQAEAVQVAAGERQGERRRRPPHLPPRGPPPRRHLPRPACKTA